MMKHSLMAGAVLALMALPGFAGDAKIMVQDAYARSTNPQVGAAFMSLMNHGAEEDRLIGASSDAAERVQLHTHRENDEGVMQMIHAEEGFALAPGEATALARGGKHVMLMGLTQALKDGDTVEVTLTFEKAGDVVVQIPVDNARKPKAAAHGGHEGHGAHDDHGGHGHSDDHSSHSN